LNFLGVKNVLALRGDGVKNQHVFKPSENGHSNADELVEQIKNLGEGKYLEADLKNNTPLDFCIGVAGYPEKHFEAPNLKSDLNHLKDKVDAGADYIVTQMFYDNQKYFDFVDRCRDMGIDVPIIPGLKPITTKNQCNVLPSIFHIDIPEDLSDAIEVCKDNKAAREVGVAWAIQQSKELIEYGVPTLHFYSMGKAEPVYRIAKELF
jgi:methylenetetrahydrofolate reductase (NADPH)